MSTRQLLTGISAGLLWVLSVYGAEQILPQPVLDWNARSRSVPAVPNFDRKSFTVLVGIQGTTNRTHILNWKTEGKYPALVISHDEGGPPASLIAKVGFDAKERPLQLGMPISALGSETNYVILIRNSGAKLDMFVDGILVDEEWPLGSLLTPKGALELSTAVTSLRIWNGALSDENVAQVSGDAEGLRARAQRMLPPEEPVGQFWKPRGFNAHVGDCMPFFSGGRFHLFYLFDRRNHGSKWGLGAHQWAHLSTTNLIDWEHHPMAVGITEQNEGSICTGSTFYHEGIYHAFYAVRMSDGSPAQLCDAVSSDGVHFKKQPPLARLRSPYQGGPGRDPVVFQDPSTKLFHMLVTTELEKPLIPRTGGCLAQLVSRDLKTWEQQDPFIIPGYSDQPECPDYFYWRGWYYLIFSNHGVARYRISRQPLGPWTRPKVETFDGAHVAVMKTAGFTGDRRLGAAFLRQSGYGGALIFREIIQQSDGTLGTKWPAELIPKTGPALRLKWQKLQGNADLSTGKVTLAPTQGISAVTVSTLPVDYHLRARVVPGGDTGCFGLRLRSGDRMQGGAELRFEPSRAKAGFRPPYLSANDENEGMSIYNVKGLSEPFTFDLILRGDYADLCVDDARTLAVRMPKSEGNSLSLFSIDANVRFEDIEIWPLAAPDGK